MAQQNADKQKQNQLDRAPKASEKGQRQQFLINT
jgi:hypothetical protein